MLSKINRKDCLNEYKVFPQRSYNDVSDKEEFFYPKIFKSYILTLPSKSFKAHTKMLGIEIMSLLKYLHEDTLIFLGDTETPWLYQHNEYKPARLAQEYLTVKKLANGSMERLWLKHLSCLLLLPI